MGMGGLPMMGMGMGGLPMMGMGVPMMGAGMGLGLGIGMGGLPMMGMGMGGLPMMGMGYGMGVPMMGAGMGMGLGIGIGGLPMMGMGMGVGVPMMGSPIYGTNMGMGMGGFGGPTAWNPYTSMYPLTQPWGGQGLGPQFAPGYGPSVYGPSGYGPGGGGPFFPYGSNSQYMNPYSTVGLNNPQYNSLYGSSYMNAYNPARYAQQDQTNFMIANQTLMEAQQRVNSMSYGGYGGGYPGMMPPMGRGGYPFGY
jgi:hypothetical protein